jgi:hypothetical protein
VLEQPNEPVPRRDRAREVADDDGEDERYLFGIPYRPTQSLTTLQSRFARKTSMYDARSVW